MPSNAGQVRSKPRTTGASTLSDAGARIAAFLSARSKAGLEHDPRIEVDDLLRDLEMGDDMLEASVAELQQHDFIATSEDACHRLAFHAMAPLAPLFWWADPATYGWSPAADAKEVARTLIAAGNPTGFVDVAELATSLGWAARRINPAIAYLVQNQHVRESHHLGGGPYGGYALHCTGATRLFVSSPVSPPPSGIYAVMFTDVVGSTALARAVGDGPARTILGRHDQLIRITVQSKGGRIVKQTGDGFYAVFPTVQASIESALTILDGLAQLNAGYPDRPLCIRVALDVGDLLAEDDDMFGLAVNRAARILGHTGTNEIVASPAIANLAESCEIVPMGSREVKDFGALELYTLKGRLRGE